MAQFFRELSNDLQVNVTGAIGRAGHIMGGFVETHTDAIKSAGALTTVIGAALAIGGTIHYSNHTSNLSVPNPLDLSLMMSGAILLICGSCAFYGARSFVRQDDNEDPNQDAYQALQPPV